MSRPRLLARLNTGLDSRLTLVSAPAGYGKTTLLSEWVSGLERPVAWLSLDRGDNDVARFLSYLIAAAQNLDERIGGGSVQTSQLPSPAAVLTPLINEVAEISTPVLLVLDDYHLVTAQPVHDVLTFLLDHLPRNLHLVIATRADPPLPLTRLRGQGQLMELRQSDLRFTPEEAFAFLHRVAGLSLAESDVGVLADRTEGWVVGLQMAALSLRGRVDASCFIEAFAGSHRLVLDYLVEEVLERQPAAVQEFLLRTSILDRMTGPLCDVVTGEPGGRERLIDLDRANLFLIPLDDERCWYRYHHLFADLLRDRLLRTGTEPVSTLHLRASEWFERQGLLAEAVGHALEAGEIGRAATLVEGNVLNLLYHRELATLMEWLEMLPADVIRSRPWLSIATAWVLTYAGRLDDVEPVLRDAEEALAILHSSQEPVPDDRHLLGHVAAIRAFVAALEGDAARAAVLARQAMERLPDSDSLTRSLTATTLTYSMRLSGDLATATRAFTEAVAISRAASDHHVAVYVLCELAQLQVVQGKLRAAAATAREAMHLADECARRSGQPAAIQGFAYTRLSAILYEWNDLAAAVPLAQEGFELCRRWGQAEILAVSSVNLARMLQAMGDAEGALEATRLGRQIASGLSDWYLANVAVIEGQIRLLQGDVAGASRSVVELGARLGGAPGIQDEDGRRILAWLLDDYGRADDASDPLARLLRGFLARLLVAWGRPADGFDLLIPLLEISEAEGAMGNAIGMLALQAVALEQRGQIDHALGVLERACSMAQPEGYVRTFLDEGQPMARLLHEAVRRGVAGDYARRLLDAFPASDPPLSPRPQVGLVEPLSERELEVMRLVAQGLSNREIGHQLHIAVGTVKNHLQNVYGKLQVHSRTQAVARCRELGVLS